MSAVIAYKRTLPLNSAVPCEPMVYDGKCTLYRPSSFLGNWQAMEVRWLSISVGPYAQHSRALHVHWLGKGKRNKLGRVFTYRPRLVVLAGWGHMQPGGPMGEQTWSQDGQVAVSRSVYSSFDDGWDRDFDAALAAYLDAHPDAYLLADYRGLLD